MVTMGVRVAVALQQRVGVPAGRAQPRPDGGALCRGHVPRGGDPHGPERRRPGPRRLHRTAATRRVPEASRC